MPRAEVWSVHYARRDLPLLDVVLSYPQGVATEAPLWLDSAGIPDGAPFLLSPRWEYDPGINAYFQRADLAEAPWNSNANRARALAGFFTFLWQCRGGKNWRDATEADHLAFHHRQHPDLVSQITQARRPEPDAPSPTVGSAQQRLHARNAKLRRANRHLTDQLKLAAAQIQHLALENAALRATLEDHAKIVHLVPRPTSGRTR